MVDNTIQKALLCLLRLGLWEKHKGESFSALSADEWALVYRYAQEHTIEGIVFDGIQSLSTHLLPPRDLHLKWIVRLDQIERHNLKMNGAIKEQLEFFYEQGIQPVLLKGQGVASCYEIPNHRISGDVDWYFENKGDFKKANELIRKRKIDILPTAGFSTEYLWNGIVIEHHSILFDLHNPFSFAYLKRLQNQQKGKRIQLVLQGEEVLLSSPILMMIQVNAHILKHLLSFGLGFRQVCDSARVYYRYSSQVNGEELKNIYKKLGILKWIHLLHAVLVKHIGLSPKLLPFDLPEHFDADWMLEEIWLSGNFGFFDERYAVRNKEDNALRNQAPRRISSNLRRYFRYAPMEAISFPLVQLYSKLILK